MKLTAKVKSDLKGLTKLKNSLRKQGNDIVEVGHFGGKPHPTGNGLTIADVSLMNQQGNKRIPARPYMLIAISNPSFLKAYSDAAKRIARNTQGVTFNKELRKLGNTLVIEMVNVINVSGPGFTPNAQKTIDLKGHEKPLVDSFAMMKDIKSRLVKDPTRKKPKGLSKVAV